MTTTFCWSIVPCTRPPNCIGNFLEMFFGYYAADRGNSSDVSEVNIELVSVMLHWQKGSWWSRMLVYNTRTSVSLYQQSPSRHTQKSSHATFPCHQHHTEASVSISAFKPLLPACEPRSLMAMMLHLQPCKASVWCHGGSMQRGAAPPWCIVFSVIKGLLAFSKPF